MAVPAYGGQTCTVTLTDLTDSWATLAVSGFTEDKWSYWHSRTSVHGSDEISPCATYDYSTASVTVARVDGALNAAWPAVEGPSSPSPETRGSAGAWGQTSGT